MPHQLTPPQREACALLYLQDLGTRTPPYAWRVTYVPGTGYVVEGGPQRHTGDTLAAAVDGVVAALDAERWGD